MKRIIIASLAVMVSFVGLSAQSPIINVDGIYYRLASETGSVENKVAIVTTLGNTEYYNGEVSIPSAISVEGVDYPVTAIDNLAFKGCKQLTSIRIPSSIKEIPSGSFYNCEKLATIVVESGNPVYDSRNDCNAVIETASNTLIAGCKNSIIPSSVTGIGECAFWGCEGLTSFLIPDNITHIDRWAFLDCTDLLTVTIPSNITSLSEGVFMGCNNLVFEIPSTITEIGSFALYDLGTLFWNSNTPPPSEVYYHSLIIGDSVTSINWNMPGMLKKLHIPSSVKSIRRQTALSLDCIEELYWNTNVSLNTINGWNHPIPSTLKSVVFGDSVEFIDPSVFFYFQQYDKEITGSSCFYLESITVEPGNPYYDSRGNCNAIIESVTRTVNCEGVDYNCIKDRLILGCMNTVIPDNVSSIGDMAFHSAVGLKSINLPSTLNSIGEYAFYCCGLSSLNIPSNVTSIGKCAFSDCVSIETITVDSNNQVYDSRDNCNAIIETSSGKLILTCKSTKIPDNITSIGSYAFACRDDLTSITIPSSVTTIGDHAFKDCFSLESVYIPSGVQRIEEGTFQTCIRLTSLVIPESIQSFGPYAFENCMSLTSFSIPSGVKAIPERMFTSCIHLASVEIPTSIRSIGDFAFCRCESLKSVIIPDGVTHISNGCFMDCPSLSYLSLPSSISHIGYNAFDGCYALETAGPKGGGYNYEFDWDTIPKDAFYNLTELKRVYIPKKVKVIYECQIDDNRYINNINGFRIFGYSSGVFFGCDKLESVSVSFKDTKLFRFWRDPEHRSNTEYKESPLDFNLYRLNPIKSITILDDTIKDLSSILMDNIKTVVISEHTNYLDPESFKFDPYYEPVEWCYDYQYDEYSYYNRHHFYMMSSRLENIEVENGNKNYSSIDGVLFNKNGTRLFAYPSNRKGEYQTPMAVTEISPDAFNNCDGLSKVTITKNVELIGERAFEGCDSLTEITIYGAPEIGLNAFRNSKQIQEVWTRSSSPGLMNISESPQTIITGNYSSIIDCDGASLNSKYDDALGRRITEINLTDRSDWSSTIITPEITDGNYKISIGILPSLDSHPNYFHAIIYGLNDSTKFVLADSIEVIQIVDNRGRIRYIEQMYYYTNDSLNYDSVYLATISVPSDCKQLMIELGCGANSSNQDRYSDKLLLDRIFIEPLDKDVPAEKCAGTFAANVFNDATLYVPDGAIDSYKAADGWRLFRNIAVNNRTYPIDEVEVTLSEYGYATFYYSDGYYALPEGLSAMVVSGLFDEKLVYEIIATGSENGIVPAGVPVVLVSDDRKAGVYKLTLTDRCPKYIGLNLLMGSDVETQTFAENSSRFYKLAYGPAGTDLSDVIGWYWGAAYGGAFNIEAHKAWLALPKTATKGITGFTLYGDATFVKEVETDKAESQKPIYNLFGHKLPTPTGTGIYIINGKKVIIGK